LERGFKQGKLTVKIGDANRNKVRRLKTHKKMFIYQKSLRVKTLPIDTIQQVSSFWEKNTTNFIDVRNLNQEEKKENRENSQLLVNPKINTLIWEKKRSPDNSQTSITSAPEEMAAVCQEINQELGKYFQNEGLKSKFTVKLLKPMMYETLQTVSYTVFEQKKELKLQQSQPKQQQFLKKVKNEISHNQDYHLIVQITLEQTLELLKLDRLAIYQLNVKAIEQEKLIDAFTYEALASVAIPSILNFQDQIFMQGIREFQEKNNLQFILSVDNVETDPHISTKLKSLIQQMQIKAKVVIPIVIQDSLWGFLVAHQCLRERQWKKNEIQFMLNTAKYLANAIYQAQSYKILEKQKSILEQQVKKRGQELEAALLATQIADSSKKQFIETMSHELRTPLTCVLGLSSTLIQLAKSNTSLPSEKQQRYLQIIHDNGKKLLTLINEILEMSSVEAGRLLLDISTFSLKNISREIIDLLQEEAKNKEIHLSLDFQILAAGEMFCGDEERIKQILYNLIENGIKFTPAGGVVILRVFREEDWVIFEIEDTGIGIAENHLSLLFKKFQQLEDSRTRTHEGTGLGLALTKQLVELHGGKIKVESTLGKGSLFTVSLPLYKKSNLKKVAPPIIPPIKAEKRTIVIVESDEEIATLICELLTAANYKVIWLIDSSTAFTHIKLLEPKVVILDSLESNSSQISQNIKELKATKHIKILLLTSELISVRGEAIAQNYADDYMAKPLQPSRLLHTIKKLLKNET